MMALALRLGKTLHELRDTMSAEELHLWKAFNRESPISDVRGDIQAAIVAASAFQAQGAKVSALDLLPKWTDPEPDPVVEAESGEELLKSFLLAKSAELPPGHSPLVIS